MATARVGSCGVSMTTTPSDVTTKLGLQPRRVVIVKTRSATRSIIEGESIIVVPSSLLGRRQAAIDAEDLTGHERCGVRAQEDGGSRHVAGLAHATHRD